jgi:flagellar motor switch protein FliM
VSQAEQQQEQGPAPPTAPPGDPATDARDPATDARDPASAEFQGANVETQGTGAGPQGDAVHAEASEDGDASGTGESYVPEDSQAPMLIRRGPGVRTVDFSQPTKFTVELRRRIARVLGPFCEACAIRLSSELRAPVELAVADASQLTWAAAKAQLPASVIAVALEVRQIERQLLLGIEPALVLQSLECLLGGTAAQADPERRLSEIDWALTRRLLESMTAQLSQAWRDLGGLQLALGEIDLEGDASVLAPIGEPTFALKLAATIDGQHSSMTLLIPWSAIEPVAEDIFGAGPKPEDADPQEGRAVRRGLAAARVLLRAEVGSVWMPVEQMLALTPGTLLTLEDRAEHGVQLYAEEVALGRAQPGLRGAHRAVKLTAEMRPGAPPAALSAPRTPAPSADVAAHEGLARMLGVPVRVWAELGRTAIALGRALELPCGTVVELDQGVDAPIELYVNGMCFAHGTLEVTASGEWAVQIDALA